MKADEYEAWAKRAAEWGAAYLGSLRDRPVRAQTAPGEIAAQIAATPPEQPEDFEGVFADFADIVPPGLTHWQHPRFFAYFPANASPASMVAEQLTSVIAAQCMLWQTSPAATEIETRMIDWLRQAVGLPGGFSGVIQDSASTSTLSAILTMREKALDWRGNEAGLSGGPQLRVYASAETHTSVDKAVWLSGIGRENLVKIPTDAAFAMKIDDLRAQITADRQAGLTPAGIVGCVGGTGIGASDDIAAICDVAEEEGLYTHIDAAWAGAAMICPEFRDIWRGAERADSIVFNPHKWLGVQFDCAAHLVRDPAALIRTMSANPEFLQTPGVEDVTDYGQWTIPLGRRFRALKLWFVLRAYGLEGLRDRIRNHVRWSCDLAETLRAAPDFEITTEPRLSLFTFRYAPNGVADLDALNLRLVQAINDDGRIYLTQTRHGGRAVIRFQAGQFDCGQEDIEQAGAVILEISRSI